MKRRSIALIGATGGIGRALVREISGPGVTLFLSGRDPDRLRHIQEISEAQGATVKPCAVSLTNYQEFCEVLSRFDDEHPLDLLICAAGVKTGNKKGFEPPQHLDRVLNVNLVAPLHLVQAVLPEMVKRRRGHIALFSSLAAFSPHADLLSYSATKAGIRAYGTALRQALRGTGVSVSVITPGFVDTPMTDRQIGPTPQKISAERAARIIVRGLERKRPYITFPLLITGLVHLKSLLPVWARDLIDRTHRARILPDDDEAGSV